MCSTLHSCFFSFPTSITHLLLCCRYFFAEVFDFFRNFFLIVFHVNILFMILPLAIRLNHRPCFLVFVYLAISSMLKSYPSVSPPIISKFYNTHVFHLFWLELNNINHFLFILHKSHLL